MAKKATQKVVKEAPEASTEEVKDEKEAKKEELRLLDIKDILPDLKALCDVRPYRRYQFGIKENVFALSVYRTDPSDEMAYFAGRTPSRDPYYVIYSSIIRGAIEEYGGETLKEFMKKYA